MQFDESAASAEAAAEMRGFLLRRMATLEASEANVANAVAVVAELAGRLHTEPQQVLGECRPVTYLRGVGWRGRKEEARGYV